MNIPFANDVLLVISPVMRLQRGRALGGFYIGSGDRQEAIARLRRWVAIAEGHLATEWIDQLASRIATYANDEAFRRAGKKFDGVDAAGEAEVAADRREHW